VFEYRAAQRQEGGTTIGEQFTVRQWESDGDWRTASCFTEEEEQWTAARFLAKASYDPYWHLWLRGVHVPTFIPGRAQLKHHTRPPQQ
jgi:hypothetical protein